MRFSACALIVCCSSLGLLQAVPAADTPVDDGLLEFLGSVDSEDKDWHDYLAGTDIDQFVRRQRNAPPKPPAPPAAGEPSDPADASPPVGQP